MLKGGSRSYLQPLTKSFENNIRLNSEVKKVLRNDESVQLFLESGEMFEFDQVVFACHSDQALAILGQSATASEKDVLAAIPYRSNDVVLHTDETLLPTNKLAWSSWNYHLRRQDQQQAVLTYNMNILQRIQAPATFCVTLNATDLIDESKILGRFNYSHPEFSLASVAASERWHDINGQNRSWFCGAYWANGFHEDGLSSGLRVADAISGTRILIGNAAGH